MNTDLTGKRAVVCGSTQGIGKACAVTLASLGAEVVLIARDTKRLEQTAKELPSRGADHAFVVADFSQPDQVKAAATEAAKKPCHILINNTGGPPGGPIADASPEQFLTAFNAHVVNNQLLTQALAPGMKDARYGRIINIISTSVKQPIPGLGVSNTIRGAVASWAKTLAGELGPFGITVNNVLPGYTTTERLAAIVKNQATKSGKTEDEIAKDLQSTIPARRFGTAEEIAAAVAFLASPAAAYISGINLPVDGGRLGCL